MPDSYIANSPPNTVGVEAQAVIDTTDGSSIPSPLPSVAWNQTGNPAPVPTAYPNWPLSACTCQQVFDAEVIGLPSAPGQTTITMTVNGAPTSTLTLLTYRGMGLRSTLDTTNFFGFLSGAMFDSNGERTGGYRGGHGRLSRRIDHTGAKSCFRTAPWPLAIMR